MAGAKRKIDQKKFDEFQKAFRGGTVRKKNPPKKKKGK
jgi:hypothetical protein